VPVPDEPVTPFTGRRLLARLAGSQVDGRLPSIVAGLVRHGGLVWSAGYGEVAGDPEDLQYRIGSITKTFTAVLVLQLVSEGRLSLDTRVGEVLGDIGYADRSVRSLLAHDSGMQAEPAGPWWERSEGSSFDELARANDGAGAVFPAQQQFHYSNLGFALLGEVAARLRGASWWECVQERVLAPLGMDRTSYLPQPPAAQGFSVHPYAGTLTPEPATDTGAMAPAGQAWSTVRDLATYAQFLVDGHPDVLPREMLLAAAHPQSGDRDEVLGHVYGLGFQLYAGGSGMLVGHGGSMPGFLAICLVDRERRTGCVAFANATTGLAPADLARALLDQLEQDEPTLPTPWQPTPRVPPELAEALGVWHWGNTAFVFGLEGGELVALKDGQEKWRFGVRDGRVVGTGGYQAGEELRVVRRPDGSVSHLDAATFVLTREPYDPEAPIPGGSPP
jgi:CubicO group peptidase (beta-lactamase class C family)